ncbi:MAG: hypothetical protein AAF715_24465 [Myxococcota bacterium]
MIAIGVAMAMPAPPAKACLNGVDRRLNEAVARVSAAEDDVSEGRPRLAAQRVLNVYPHLRRQRPEVNRVADRALRVMALAVVRTRGTVDGGRRFPGDTPELRDHNIVWAQRILRGFARRAPKDAAAQTGYAEALALRPERQAEALRLLTRLSTRDLVSSAHGYAALAELLRPPKPKANTPFFLVAARASLALPRRTLAGARCRRMAGENDDDVCGAPPRPPEG